MAKIKRGSTDYSLLIGLNKPAGMTSHDCVNAVRKIFGERRVGHSGTLDPFASGVLPIMIGPATKLMPYFNKCRKQYIAGIKFGSSTNTDDVEGDVVTSGKPTEELYSENFARHILSEFVGHRMQKPPKFSAVKVGGIKSYDAARRGIDLELREREVVIAEATLLSIEKDYDNNCEPIWFVRFDVTSGTYIRSIARDIGEAVGVPAHLRCLSRMQVSRIPVEECYTLDEIANMTDKAYVDPVYALNVRPFLVEESLEKKIRNGSLLTGNDLRICDIEGASENELFDGDELFMCTEKELLAIYKFNEEKQAFAPQTVFSKGVKRV